MGKSVCRGCGAEIIWAKSATTGKDMPLDAKSETRFVIEGGGGQPVTAKALQVRTSHFATCPRASDFRGGGDRS